MIIERFIKEYHSGYRCDGVSYFVNIQLWDCREEVEINVSTIEKDKCITLLKSRMGKEDGLKLMDNEDKILDLLQEVITMSK